MRSGTGTLSQASDYLPSLAAPPVCDNQEVRFHSLSLLLLTSTMLSLGCRAQTPNAVAAAPAKPEVGKPLTPATARRVEVLLRQKASLPPGSTVSVGVPVASELPGYLAVPVAVVSGTNTSRPINFLLSADGRTVAQFSKFDISGDPRNLVAPGDRPGRGGPATAPVVIVGFDDLECPYCARLHAEIFPALTARYGDKVHFVYKDFPLDQHPWAMRAAIDVNCLGTLSTPGYWNAVDYIHAHAGEIGQAPAGAAPEAASKPDASKPDKTVSRANEQLDSVVRQQAQFQKADTAKLDACVAKQDTAAIETSKQLGTKLGVDSTPSLFINGDKIDGALPLEFIFGIVDDALRAEGVAPPPPYAAPKPSVPASASPAGTD